jgi:hypothetical protein
MTFRISYSSIVWAILAVMVYLPIVSFGQDEYDLGNRRTKNTENAEKRKIKPRIDTWILTHFGALSDSISVDTLMNYYHLYHPVYKNNITISELGNYGLPYLNNDFFQRETKNDFLFSATRKAYLLNPSDIIYYNTRTPYSILDYSQSENKSRKNETRFNVLHTQNLNPYLNITFRIDMARSMGQYKNQESKNRFVTLYSSYNKDRFNIYGGFIANRMQNDENGGLDSDDLIHLEDQDYINIRLVNSGTRLANTTFFANGEYRIGNYYLPENDTIEHFKPQVGILYSFDYQRNNKVFTENEDPGSTFFRRTLFIPDFNNDSISFNKLRNIIQLKHYEDPNKKFTFGKSVYLGQEFVSLSMPFAKVDLDDRVQKKYTNIYIGGGIFRELGNFWTWNFEGRQYLIGRNAGQTELTGVISKPLKLWNDSITVLTVRGKIENTYPDIFQEEFYSNHKEWKQNLKMEQRMVVNGSIRFPCYRLEAGANYALINNFIYTDTTGMPAQTGKELLVVSAYLDKDFVFRKLHFHTRALWQNASSKTYVRIPDFSAYISTYYQFMLYKVMHVQLGIDGKYSTKFYANAYDPSTGLFHLQDVKKIGGYPYLDAYVTLKLKRTKVFFKVMNIGADKLIIFPMDYFTTLHYPMNRTTYRIGVNWSFYD